MINGSENVSPEGFKSVYLKTAKHNLGFCCAFVVIAKREDLLGYGACKFMNMKETSTFFAVTRLWRKLPLST